jgi:hypothetical protein
MASELDRHLALVEDFVRGFGYAPTSADVEEFLIERHRLTAEQAEEAVVAWEARNERPEEGRSS